MLVLKDEKGGGDTKLGRKGRRRVSRGGEYNPKISLTVSKNKEEIKKHLNVAI